MLEKRVDRWDEHILLQSSLVRGGAGGKFGTTASSACDLPWTEPKQRCAPPARSVSRAFIEGGQRVTRSFGGTRAAGGSRAALLHCLQPTATYSRVYIRETCLTMVRQAVDSTRGSDSQRCGQRALGVQSRVLNVSNNNRKQSERAGTCESMSMDADISFIKAAGISHRLSDEGEELHSHFDILRKEMRAGLES